MDFGHINYVACLVAGIAAFAIGFVWYGVFLKTSWQKAHDLSDEKIQSGNMAVTYLSSLVLMILMAIGMSGLMGHDIETMEFMDGFHYGAVLGFFIAAMGMGINFLYLRKPFKAWLMDAFYQIIFCAVMGGILAIW